MTGRSALDRMKTRNFYMVALLAVVSTASLWVFTSSSSLQNFVSKTHSEIKRASSNIQDTDVALTVDRTYLHHLGLASIQKKTEAPADAIASGNDPPGIEPNPKLPTPQTTNSLPVVATAAQPDKFKETEVLMRSIQSYLPGYTVVVFDLGLSTADQLLLGKYCNATWSCEVVLFAFDKYPSHVKYLNIRSYRPLCIQETLKKFGAVIWVDEGLYFTSSNVTPVISRAKSSGIQAWTIPDPTSAFTHPKMFEFFETGKDSYYFKHTVESSHLVIYNSEQVAKKLMLPWVKCSLLEACINPPGAQDTGCKYFRKPLFRYTGCHRYDMSALSIILGQMFLFDESRYVYNDRLFGSLLEDQLRAENKTLPQDQIRVAVGQQITKM